MYVIKLNIGTEGPLLLAEELDNRTDVFTRYYDEAEYALRTFVDERSAQDYVNHDAPRFVREYDAAGLVEIIEKQRRLYSLAPGDVFTHAGNGLRYMVLNRSKYDALAEPGAGSHTVPVLRLSRGKVGPERLIVTWVSPDAEITEVVFGGIELLAR